MGVSASGCDGPPPPELPGFVVYGLVTGASGAPSANSFVDVRSYRGPCATADTALRVGLDAYTTTDETGRYSAVVTGSLAGPVEGRCVAVRAGRANAPGVLLPGATLADATVESRFELPYDSLRVDVRVP